jgi:hypothetical protein
MTTTTRTAAVISLTMLVVPLVLTTSASAVSSDPPWFCTQPVETSRLPRTPDAIEGWFSQCPRTFPDSARRTTTGVPALSAGCAAPLWVPRSADAATAWLDQRR